MPSQNHLKVQQKPWIKTFPSWKLVVHAVNNEKPSLNNVFHQNQFNNRPLFNKRRFNVHEQTREWAPPRNGRARRSQAARWESHHLACQRRQVCARVKHRLSSKLNRLGVILRWMIFARAGNQLKVLPLIHHSQNQRYNCALKIQN